MFDKMLSQIEKEAWTKTWRFEASVYHENKTSFSSGITLRGVLQSLTMHDLDSFVPF